MARLFFRVGRSEMSMLTPCKAAPPRRENFQVDAVVDSNASPSMRSTLSVSVSASGSSGSGLDGSSGSESWPSTESIDAPVAPVAPMKSAESDDDSVNVPISDVAAKPRRSFNDVKRRATVLALQLTVADTQLAGGSDTALEGAVPKVHTGSSQTARTRSRSGRVRRGAASTLSSAIGGDVFNGILPFGTPFTRCIRAGCAYEAHPSRDDSILVWR